MIPVYIWPIGSPANKPFFFSTILNWGDSADSIMWLMPASPGEFKEYFSFLGDIAEINTWLIFFSSRSLLSFL